MAEPVANGCRVTVANTGQSFTCGADELILDAGLGAGLPLPHNCRGGACGTCKAEILEGSVDHGWVMSFAITDDEKAAGKCLICQSKPTSAELHLRMDGAMAAAEEAPPAPIEVRGVVVAAEPVTRSIRRLVIALPAGLRFRYRPGMHVELITPDVRKPRTYSIATAPDADGQPPDGLLEFFVTHHEGGRASGWLHAPERLGDEIGLHGPYGTFHLPKAAGAALCLAGGSGLAPILSIVRAALARGHGHPIMLIFSVRDRAEVFALDQLHRLARRHANFSYLITLTRARSVPSASGWRLGRIPTWLGEALPDLSSRWVLAAGPPGFVDSAVEVALGLGAQQGRVLVDSFTPTP